MHSSDGQIGQARQRKANGEWSCHSGEVCSQMSHVDFNTMIMIIVAMVNTYVAWVTNRTRKEVKIVEKATNSMKDALVAATAKASLAEGTAAGLAQGRSEHLQK